MLISLTSFICWYQHIPKPEYLEMTTYVIVIYVLSTYFLSLISAHIVEKYPQFPALVETYLICKMKKDSNLNQKRSREGSGSKI